jgi:hypothetical protein
VVHVLQVDLTQGTDLAAYLSPDEHERAARLKDPTTWIAARAALRTALAHRLDTDPQAIAFRKALTASPSSPATRCASTSPTPGTAR